jgi:PAS domain S-box-containing protein
MSAMIIEQVTNNCIEFWGYSQEEMKGKSLLDFLHPNDAESTKNIAAIGLLDIDPIRGFKNRYMHKNGVVICNEWNTTRTFNNVCLGDCKLIPESEFEDKKPDA